MGAASFYFNCPVWKDANNSWRGWDEPRPPRHQVRLTGRTKPNPSNNRGSRTSNLVREYVCETCGHSGWSKHIDLERLEKRNADR